MPPTGSSGFKYQSRWRRAKEVHRLMLERGDRISKHFYNLSPLLKKRLNKIGISMGIGPKPKLNKPKPSKILLSLCGLLCDIIQHNENFGPVTALVISAWRKVCEASAERYYNRLLVLLRNKKIPFDITCDSSGKNGIVLKMTIRDVDRYAGEQSEGTTPPQ